MDIAQILTSPVAASFGAGTIALIGALGSQAISARTTLKTKRLELAYGKKAQLYQNYLVEVARFLHDSEGEEKYRPYLEAYMAVRLIAPPKILSIINAKEGEKGLHNYILMLRAYDKYSEKHNLISGPIFELVEKLQEAMREDLRNFTKV